MAVAVDLESGTQYPVENKTATISVKDNLVLESVMIYLNNNKVNATENGENYSFAIPASNQRQSVKAVAVDAAGNEYTFSWISSPARISTARLTRR